MTSHINTEQYYPLNRKKLKTQHNVRYLNKRICMLTV